ncbi:DUF190 domain-containing protein [Rhodospirillum rubrum]|uniref:Uncharacterized protein n=1 Tax=Rhodospirillum rubrum (strain ATCC 11170 / ATH 1.1.1 / DSM 467 / LMG 4362 / NCIMB 8255 / S1) TaxID=269796 RepID=Q2RXV3_RHORT|nr:DUF190 domain-containing protein [Rhodospirillum rubrum]ABC21042.1 Protein of unknown function DUF190 [Rhodospirillum rubrum ATCC 11170]AEO46709.1 hypothetical protein F11_01195 [Rhodospirillum rubrum F11]MBK5952586.1 hypothetical protein [Rhodospirillum rubrum]QXG80739.1 DUF190 domain-containing protein [Rhodospirillum rubrum]HAQ00856.1 DUF190 domain-containing protein [Rhodospirillum rubrum]
MDSQDIPGLPKDAVLLRIYTSERKTFGHAPLFEAIVTKALEMGLAGATVLRGPLGYGHSSRIHTAKILDLSNDLPVVIEIAESQARIDAFLPVLDGMIGKGLVTLEKIQVLHYGPRAG